MSEKAPKFTRDLPETRRRQLIEATARSLARHGLDGTTVRVVAAEAGVSPGLVRHHFAGMHDLIAETYRWTGKGLEKVLRAALANAAPTPEGQLRAFIDSSFITPPLDTDLLSVWLTFWSLTRTDPEIHAIHEKVYASYRRRLDELLTALAAEKKLALNTRLATLAFTALLDGLWLEHCLDATTFPAKDAAIIAHDWLDALINGHFMASAARTSIPQTSLLK